jgi:hypothetical protein
VRPILHLSLPVRALDESEDFYVGALGCHVARRRPDFIDVWFFGLQLTLHDRPSEVTGLVPGGSRHFGVTLEREEFDAVVARLDERGVEWLVPVATDDAGMPTEQTKAKLADPSGHVIEVKTYPDMEAALEIPTRFAEATRPEC